MSTLSSPTIIITLLGLGLGISSLPATAAPDKAKKKATTTHAKAKSQTEETPAPAKKRPSAYLHEQDNPLEEKEAPVTNNRVDFAPLSKHRPTGPIRQTMEKRLIIPDLPDYHGVPNSPRYANKTESIPNSTKTKETNTTSVKVEPKVKESTTKKTDTSPTKPNKSVSKNTTLSKPKTKPPVSETIRTDTAMPVKPKVAVEADTNFFKRPDLSKPLTPAKDMGTVYIQEIPILEFKNRPKYLIPVDSITRIKGQFYYLRARQYLEKGNYPEGEKCLRKSLEINQNNAPAWTLHADLYLANKATEKALHEYHIATEIDSTNAKVYYNMAMIYHDINQDQRAYQYFSKAIEVNDKYLLAYISRAALLMDQHDFAGAIEDYDKAIGVNRYYSTAYKARAIAFMELKRFKEAIADFDMYLEIEDPDGYIICQRGMAKILSNNLLQGCLDFATAMDMGYKDAEKAIKKYCE